MITNNLGFRDDRERVRSIEGEKPRMLVLGDSHAKEWSLGTIVLLADSPPIFRNTIS